MFLVWIFTINVTQFVRQISCTEWVQTITYKSNHVGTRDRDYNMSHVLHEIMFFLFTRCNSFNESTLTNISASLSFQSFAMPQHPKYKPVFVSTKLFNIWNAYFNYRLNASSHFPLVTLIVQFQTSLSWVAILIVTFFVFYAAMVH